MHLCVVPEAPATPISKHNITLVHNFVGHMLNHASELPNPDGVSLFMAITAAAGCSELCLQAFVTEFPIFQLCSAATREDCETTRAPCPELDAPDRGLYPLLTKGDGRRLRAVVVISAATLLTVLTVGAAAWLWQRDRRRKAPPPRRRREYVPAVRSALSGECHDGGVCSTSPVRTTHQVARSVQQCTQLLHVQQGLRAYATCNKSSLVDANLRTRRQNA